MRNITAHARSIAARRTPRPLPSVTTRIVTDRRWIPVNQAKIGMYVSQLDLPWAETSFLFQGFRIQTLEELAELRRVCESVCIDSEKLSRVSSNSTYRLTGATRR